MAAIQVIPFSNELIHEAAELFTENYHRLRQAVNDLPDRMGNIEIVAERLAWILGAGGGLAAVENGRLAGYITWLINFEFRETSKKAAYCPEWGHAARGENDLVVYRELYNAVTRCWVDADIEAYALTYLADNHTLDTFLYHNGFGMIVMDAIRPIHFRSGRQNEMLHIRRCCLEDAQLIASLEKEHWGYYEQPPTLMAPRQAHGAEAITDFLNRPNNSYWLAEVEEAPAGLMRFEFGNRSASSIVRSDRIIAITGAYTLPRFRGHGAAPAILQAALDDYAGKGFTSCSVDFETINPNAYLFWQKYFQPVCYSSVRYPEKYL